MIEQASRSLDRFKTDAEKYAQIVKGKTEPEIEKLFWKSIQNSSPVYGSDVTGTLFDDEVPWNLNELRTILNDGLGDQKILGVTSPYVYFGSWKTMFGWHKEDLDLHAINYVHHGHPKFWYSINNDSHDDFMDFMRLKFKDSFQQCDEFIRHKSTMVNPKILLDRGIKMVKAIHRAGEFMIVRAKGFHSGFNFGFNVAEAINFALVDWIPIGAKAGVCKCAPNNVKINIRSLCLKLGLDPEQHIPPECMYKFMSPNAPESPAMEKKCGSKKEPLKGRLRNRSSSNSEPK
mmetsp:Transcript_32522/g.49744  ORF Transcript_32522/g.49744 Transcript_32522/m.49744 type:complete len:289 (-) Transcript_32522:1110-1976(-)